MTDTPVLFITTTPASHKSGTFRLLGARMQVLFLFFSRGCEHYKSASGTPQYDGLTYQNLGVAGRGRLRTVLALLRIVSTFDYNVMVKCINGKIELVLCYCICRLRGRKFVLYTGIWKWPESRIHRFGRPLLRHICRGADAVCTYGSHVSTFLRDEGIRDDRLFVVHQPVQPNRRFHSSGRRPYDSTGPFRLLFVGRLIEAKGLDTLLDAAVPLADRVSLTVAGDGPQRSQLEAKARRAGLDVAWIGQQGPHDLAALYRQSHCVVIPSITTPMTREPWGFVANEAMLSGCVVVASTAVGAAAGELIRHGVTGLVYEEGDHDALQQRLVELVTDPARCQALGRAGENEARRFTEERSCEAFVAAIESVLS